MGTTTDEDRDEGGGWKCEGKIEGGDKGGYGICVGSIFMLRIPAYHLTTIFNACFVTDKPHYEIAT